MGILDGKVAIVTGASRGIGAEIARRFAREGAAVAVAARTTDTGTSPFPGTIAETTEQIRAAGGIAVNALSPNRVVPTPGTLFHHLTSEDDPNSEPPSVMAEAALRLCSAEPKTLTGRIARSQELLAELAPR